MTERLKLLHEWLGAGLGIKDYTLLPASEDASFRRYFRISYAGLSRIIMDAPPEKEDCGPYIDITGRLLECGVTVPEIQARELSLGFLLLDDLGTDLYLQTLTEDNADTLYAQAIGAIIKMQTGARTDGLPPYNETLLLDEMGLFRDWLLDRHLGMEKTSAVARILEDSFSLLKQAALQQPKTFVHRDYHSRNLLVSAAQNPGIIDFQDAVSGPVSYDLVSLLKDCYIKWPRQKIKFWAQAYYRQARELSVFDTSEKEFLRWFDLMGVQRHLKASGIFARLCHRDGKTEFLNDIPRTLSYILDLEQEYPQLQALIGLIRDRVLPALEEDSRTCVQ